MERVKHDAKIRDKLARLATWTSEELKEELRKWPDKELLELWELLKPTFQLMCHRFGRIPSHKRVYRTHLHQQIKRIGVLQNFARNIARNLHLGGQ